MSDYRYTQSGDDAYSLSNDNRVATITTDCAHGHNIGDMLLIYKPDRRWWRRLLHWLLRRPPPTIAQKFEVKSVASSTTFEVEK